MDMVWIILFLVLVGGVIGGGFILLVKDMIQSEIRGDYHEEE